MLIAITKLSHDKSVEQGKESLNAIANVTTAILLAGAGAVGGLAGGAVASTAVSAAGTYLTPIIVTPSGDAEQVRNVTAAPAAEASDSLWVHAVEKAAQNNFLSQDDFRIVTDLDPRNTGNSENSAADTRSLDRRR